MKKRKHAPIGGWSWGGIYDPIQRDEAHLKERLKRLKEYEPSGALIELLMRERYRDLPWRITEEIVRDHGQLVWKNLCPLDHFWKNSAQWVVRHRIILLRRYVHCEPDIKIENQVVRVERGLNAPTQGLLCWSCCGWEARAWHHIIPIAAGGIDDAVNKVPVCGECHREIHKILKGELNAT